MPKVIVYHAYYGCETGCCGHVVSVDGEEGEFHFNHPGYNQPVPEFIRDLVTSELGEEHVKDIDWDNCLVLED